MNLILLEKKELDSSTVLLENHRAKHIIEVLKPEIGQSIKVGLVNNNIGQGKVISIKDACVELELYNFTTCPPSPAPVTLVIAMQRPKTLRKILQSATAMGVKKFIILETWKVEKSYWTSPLLQPDKLEEQFILGLEQAGDTVLPEVIIKKRFKPFVEDELPGTVKGTTGLIAHPYCDAECPHQVKGPVTLAIGPEGGFTEYEIEKMTQAGMQPVSMGTRILRSEFAMTAIMGKIF